MVFPAEYKDGDAPDDKDGLVANGDGPPAVLSEPQLPPHHLPHPKQVASTMMIFLFCCLWTMTMMMMMTRMEILLPHCRPSAQGGNEECQPASHARADLYKPYTTNGSIGPFIRDPSLTEENDTVDLTEPEVEFDEVVNGWFGELELEALLIDTVIVTGRKIWRKILEHSNALHKTCYLHSSPLWLVPFQIHADINYY